MFKDIEGTNQRMRRLLGAKFGHARLPKATLKLGSPQRSPSLIEVAYSSHVKPETFVAGCGMPVPAKVESWLADEPPGEM